MKYPGTQQEAAAMRPPVFVVAIICNGKTSQTVRAESMLDR